MRINDDVANVLANSRVEGNKLFLPEGQLDRKLYVDVNKVLDVNGFNAENITGGLVDESYIDSAIA